MDQRCFDCNRPSPPVHSKKTLLSASHGWRLTRVQNRDGSLTLQWRCPTCWNRRKQSLAAPAAPQTIQSPRGVFRAATRLVQGDSEKPPPSNRK
jgi:hypothetical protein